MEDDGLRTVQSMLATIGLDTGPPLGSHSPLERGELQGHHKRKWDPARQALFTAAGANNVVEQHMVDIRYLDQDSRSALLEGPLVQIMFSIPGQDAVFSTIENIPKRLLMAMSGTAQEAFQRNPESLRLSLSRADASPKAVRWVCAWLINSCLQEKAFMFNYREDWFSDVSVYQVMNTLQIRGSVAHIRRSFQSQISAGWLSYDQMTSLLSAITPNDPIFRHLAYKYSWLRYNQLIPDPDQFSRYLPIFPAFAQALDQIDKKMSDKRVRQTKETERERVDCRRAYSQARKHLQSQKSSPPHSQHTKLGTSRKDLQAGKQEIPYTSSSDSERILGKHIPKGPGDKQGPGQQQSTTASSHSEQAPGNHLHRGPGKSQSSRVEKSTTGRSGRKVGMDNHVQPDSGVEEKVRSEKQVVDTKHTPGFKILRIVNT
ncbi:hypothetical protein BU16DRAFT_554745 [Lophium mytilinum]|uniref:Uncharacterized protein n=1 Tax=Lophium mytilinum TaxID=390894 RepID=A0A6A6RG19_9PEZI|nr:hypothetical protein BU16DRAFT_554745 [Lophium mytilinum]